MTERVDYRLDHHASRDAGGAQQLGIGRSALGGAPVKK
jgi:hypothetical protein